MGVRYEDLPASVRAKLKLEEKSPPRKKRSTSVAGTDVLCRKCGTRLTSEPAMFRHRDENPGHRTFEVNLQPSPD